MSFRFGDNCPHCGTAYTKEFCDKSRELKITRLIHAQKKRKALGLHTGRPRKVNYKEILDLRRRKLPIRAIARLLKCSVSTVHAAIKEKL